MTQRRYQCIGCICLVIGCGSRPSELGGEDSDTSADLDEGQDDVTGESDSSDSAATEDEGDGDGDGNGDGDGDGDGDGAPACPGPFALIESQADVWAYSNCVVLESVHVHITQGVVDVSLPQLEIVTNYFYLHINADLETVSAPALREVGGYVYAHQNPVLTSLNFESLELVGDYFYVYQNPSLSEFVLTNALIQIGGYATIFGNGSLCPPPLDWEAITVGAVNLSGNACP